MLIGFCGLPNSGKSTFLKLLSKIEIEIANYPFTTLKPKEAIVPIFSKELKEFHNITKTKEIIPGVLKFLDVPGLIRGAHKGEGLGNEFLSYLRQCDVILEIVRIFQNENAPHPENTIDPERDILIIEEEIIQSEKNIINKNFEKLKKSADKNDIKKTKVLEDILLKAKQLKRFTEYEEALKEFNLLITKDWYLIFNGSQVDFNFDLREFNFFKNVYSLDFKWELDLSEEKNTIDELKLQVDDFLEKFRKDLGLIQFFTATNEITQSWFAKEGSSVFDCAGLIHSDFQNKFTKAEIINLTEFENIGNLKEAKNSGVVKLAGRESIVSENDIIKILV